MPTATTRISLSSWVSFLKEFFGENATVENDYGYEMLPKIGPRLPASAWTTMGTFHMMRDGRIKGYFAWGMNPAHSTPNAKFARNAMANLDWLVCADWFPTETATFWKAPDMDPAKIQTGGVLPPGCADLRKDRLDL